MYWHMAKEILFKDIFVFSSGRHVMQPNCTFCSILIESIMRNISVKYFEFGPGVQEMSFEYTYYLEV